MFTAKNLVYAASLEEAYTLNQKRSNKILGGMMWLKMSSANIHTAIDISGLGLQNIEETKDGFSIGAMTSLRDLELHKGLDTAYGGLFREAVRHIVGVQFRNTATVGGSIFSRFGFSDVLTALLCLDTSVSLYKGGHIPLEKFIAMPYDNDILVKIKIKKEDCQTCYQSRRITATDFPLLACAVSQTKGKWRIALGARPSRACLVDVSGLSENPGEAQIDALLQNMHDTVKFGSNMRGSEQYRQILADVFIKRAVGRITGGGVYAD